MARTKRTPNRTTPTEFREVVLEFKEAFEELVNLRVEKPENTSRSNGLPENRSSGLPENRSNGLQTAIRLMREWTERLKLECAILLNETQPVSSGVAEGGNEEEIAASSLCRDDTNNEEEYHELEHDDAIFGERSSEEEDKDTKARKRQRRNKGPGAKVQNKNEDKAEYEVEAIIDSGCLDSGEVKYLVHWKTYPESARTWEPVENLVGSNTLITAFHAANPDKPGPIHIPTPAPPTKSLKRQRTSDKIEISEAYIPALGNLMPTSYAKFRKGITDAEMKKEGVPLRNQGGTRKELDWNSSKWSAFAVMRKGTRMDNKQSCSNCTKNRGIFEGCWKWEGDLRCANCLWNKAGCNK